MLDLGRPGFGNPSSTLITTLGWGPYPHLTSPSPSPTPCAFSQDLAERSGNVSFLLPWDEKGTALKDVEGCHE